MTLRMRTLIASGVAFAALFIMGGVVFLQFTLTSASAQDVQDALSPAVDATASLNLAQSDASGSLSDYIMLQRPRSLTSYRDSVAKATSLLDQIAVIIPDDDLELEALLTTARTTQEAWIASDGEPSLVAMLSGQQVRAVRITNAKVAWTSYDAMTEASNALAKQINRSRDDASEVVNGFTVFLGLTLLIVGILITLGMVAFLLGLQHWVLVPLRRLRHDLQQAARLPGHQTPIRPTGPPELRDVAVDGEYLRRGLVVEIDEAQAAREGLAQDAPLVAAMRAELAAPLSANVTGIVVSGLSQSAEGVMTGDWWDQIARPDGTLAIVVADVSGHGPEASVTAIRVRSILRSGLERGLSLEAAVDMAAASCAHDDHFVTGIVLAIDPVGNTVSWLNAGHHPAILVTNDKDASLCEPTGPLISSLGGTWTVRSRYFRPGDVLVAFTDGLVESRNADGDELESSMVSQFIRGLDSWVREDPEELISRLLAQVRHRAADWRRDDVTLVAVSRSR